MSPATKKIVPARKLKDGCNTNTCKKFGRKCSLFSDLDRCDSFEMFNNLGDLQSQREFIMRHINIMNTKQKTTKQEQSRRQKTMQYYLTLGGSRLLVCKRFFLATLGITDKMVRMAILKTNDSGVIEKEMRGGRQRSQSINEKERMIRNAISVYIDRYPKMESHYCRKNTSRQYLHPDLTLRKMYLMFLEDWATKNEGKPSFSTYERTFKTTNLFFFSPKKDLCSLCTIAKTGTEQQIEQLREKYKKHVSEKEKVREIKEKQKQQAIVDRSLLCGCFDLQQVIYLPTCNENALFYKNRLANFNLTFYDIATRDCFCWTWHEGISKRGASEVATAIYKTLEYYNDNGVTQEVALFADGCRGQNKNTIMAAMLLYAVAHFNNLKEISLRFFESFHGQNEGDSAHSAIGYAMKHSGNIYVPSQLNPVFSLARQKQPYKVKSLNTEDFLDFKQLSKDLRILTVRKSDLGNQVKWTDIMEIKVKKDSLEQIFFKESHHEKNYDSLSLKRNQQHNIKTYTFRRLNAGPNKISKDKYQDLVSLCSGFTPVIRQKEHQDFFNSLAHLDE